MGLKIKTVLMICLYYLNSINGYAQVNYKFAKAIGNNGAEQGTSIAVDDSGNMYLIGTYNGTVDFDPGTGTQNIEGPGVFCSKYDSLGNYIWAFGLKIYSTTINKLVLDASANVYITGTYSGTVDFDPSANTANLTAPLSSSYQFMAKYTKDGNYVWAKKLEGQTMNAGCLAVDLAQNVYLTGSFRDRVDLDPGPDSVHFLGDTQDQIYFAKYDINGSFIWGKILEGNNVDLVTCIALDKQNNILLTGITYGNMDLDPGVGVFKTTFIGNTDVFFAKYDNTGNFLWGHALAEFDIEQSGEIEADNNGNVYVSGAFSGTLDFDLRAGVAKLNAHGKDGFVAKYDAEGNYLWAHNVGNADPDFCYSLAFDNASNVYVTGVSESDILLAKYAGDGISQWKHKIGAGYFDIGYGIAVNKQGNIYITGMFTYTVDFDPSDAINQLTSVLEGGQQSSRDCFFAKYCQTLEKPASITGIPALCVGTKEVTYTVPPVNGATSYSWSLPGGTTIVSGSTTNSITINFDLAIGGNISVKAINNCGSSISSPAFPVTVYPKPYVVLDPFAVAICIDQTPFALTGGRPTGGAYSGKGVVADYFYPAVAGQGNHPITYSYTDTRGCANSYTQEISVSVCTKIAGLTTADITARSFPNPFNQNVTFQLENVDHLNSGELVLYNSTGGEIRHLAFYNSIFTVNRDDLANGIYFYRLFVNNQVIATGKLAVE